jgi:hypothetical protein
VIDGSVGFISDILRWSLLTDWRIPGPRGVAHANRAA